MCHTCTCIHSILYISYIYIYIIYIYICVCRCVCMYVYTHHLLLWYLLVNAPTPFVTAIQTCPRRVCLCKLETCVFLYKYTHTYHVSWKHLTCSYMMLIWECVCACLHIHTNVQYTSLTFLCVCIHTHEHVHVHLESISECVSTSVSIHMYTYIL